MKKSTLSSLLVFFLLIPATLFLGMKLPGRSYYITSTLIILELLLPFFLAFEQRKPQARELVLIAVMCAISIVSRVAIPIPYFKPTFAIIMLSGVAFGPQAGFLIGAITAFGSNFFIGHGAYTPWQMMAYGAGGLAAGFFCKKEFIPKKPLPLAVFGFFAAMLWVGPLLDLCSVFLMPLGNTLDSALAVFAAGVPTNLIQSASTFMVLLLLSKPLLDRLQRVQIKYGMLGADTGK